MPVTKAANLVELCEPVRGLLTDDEIDRIFTRNPSTGRPVDLSCWILPVTRTIAERWGVLDGERQLAGQPLDTADGMIAATAFEHGLTIVTRNVRGFIGLGVTVLNPWDAI